MFALHVPRPAPRPLQFDRQSATAPLLSTDPPGFTEAAEPSLPRYWPASSGTAFYGIASAPQGGVFTFSRGLPGDAPASIGMAELGVFSPSNSGAKEPLAQQWSFVHEGSRIQLEINYNQHGYLLRIDDRFISLDPHRNTGRTIVTLDFGSHRRRRIDLISWALSFGGVFTDPTDSIYAAELRGPRTIVFGDSFTTPEPTNWVNWFAHAMGWDDVWASGAGGTGFVANALGTAWALPERVAHDIAPYDPQLVLVQAGLNDFTAQPADVLSAVTETVRRIRASCPEAIIAGGANAAYGVESYDAQALDVADAIRVGMEDNGAVWLSPLELPLEYGGQPIGAEASLQFDVAAGQAGNDGDPATVNFPNGFTCSTATDTPLSNLRNGSVVEIGSGATRERVAITSVGYFVGRLVYGFDGAMRYAHAAGEPVREVGPCFVTGQGNTLSPNGWGSADRFVGSDGFHYSPEGHRALGAANASLLRAALRERMLI